MSWVKIPLSEVAVGDFLEVEPGAGWSKVEDVTPGPGGKIEVTTKSRWQELSATKLVTVERR